MFGLGVEVALFAFVVADDIEAHGFEADALACSEGDGHAVLEETVGEVEGVEG